ncbi:puromycin-sensitive aminopeptidase isoform X2 [Nasonia vitripennis]|uniref:Aminopeptidase n=1 Tax=Nasonia vitripennis TaxID=7425 RepID=A0A7M7HBJ2_NASVI|nr:puromycin-sensitive aminopeptidase isoform X2 [Nasonia vitripennis]
MQQPSSLVRRNVGMAQFHRLPKAVQPVNYDISIVPNLETFVYTGKEKITVNVFKSTKSIKLNSIDLLIRNVTFNSGNKYEILSSDNIVYNNSDETVTINFEKDLPVGNGGILEFDFDGIINEKLNGFYRSKYVSNGVTKFAAVTQFAPTDARRCFPCWDEPAIKATFDITLTVSKGLQAISNMAIKSIKDDLNMITITFERTPIMSTYLVAFMVCNYSFLKKQLNDKIIRLYAPKDRIKDGEFSLDVASKALSFYESYFNVSYPLSKLDMITVADVSFGAMENWGLITYREAVLLVDSENSSIVNKQKVALTVAHELAHQWFGNLVTMEWWTDLWLNEGYASFMQYLSIDHLYPEYNIWIQFLMSTFIKALELDALANTHPIEVPVENPSEITEIFDQISYSKGASIIRMIHNYIGADDFQKGMTLYLNRHAYSNVQTEDLWNDLEETSSKPINKIMSTWTKLPGFPLVSVTENDTNDDSKNRIFIFSQERFYINGSVDNTNTIWMIPITLSTAPNPEKVFKVIILDKKSKVIEIENVPKNAWIKVNVGTVGFFRTLYSRELLKKLLIAIREQSLPASDRLGLLDDLFVIVQSGRKSTAEYLKLLKEFENEREYIVWSSILNNLRKINNILSNESNINSKFKKFGRIFLSQIHSKLGWTPKPTENHLQTLLRLLVLSQLVEFEDASVISEAQRRFQMHVEKESILPADFRSLVYGAVLSVGNSETYEKMLSLYRETSMHEEKNRILSALGSIKDVNILQKILEFSMSEEVRAQDALQAIASVTKSHQGKQLAWQYFKNNCQTFIKRYQSGTLLTRIVETITESFVTEEVIEDIQGFFKNNPVSGTERTVRQSIEIIRFNVAWLNRDKEAIKEFLNLNKDD